MANDEYPHLNDLALHQIRHLEPDPNITFLGGAVTASVQVQENEPPRDVRVVVWIARHSVFPDDMVPRAMAVVPPDRELDALVEGLGESILGPPESPFGAMMPGTISVVDLTTAEIVRRALPDVVVDVTIMPDAHILEEMISHSEMILRQHLRPEPEWEIPVEVVRELGASVANLFRRDPWEILPDGAPPVVVMLNRHGLDTLWISLVSNMGDMGLVVFCSEADFHHAGKLEFLVEEAAEVHGDLASLDVPDEDRAMVQAILQRPESLFGNAFTIFFKAAGEMDPEALERLQAMRMPLASRQAVPNILRTSLDHDPRRPNADEAKGLRLALEAFNSFVVRHREQLEAAAWHLAPIASQVQVKEGTKRASIPVSLASFAPVLDPALHAEVLRLRVMLESDRSVWREIEIEAKDPLYSLADAIYEAFDWPSDEGTFLAFDPYDGEETYETRLLEDAISDDDAPVGVLLRKPRDFAHFIVDPGGKSVSHRVRLLEIGPRVKGMSYPRVIEVHGETPDLFDDEEIDLEQLDLDDDSFTNGDDDDD